MLTFSRYTTERKTRETDRQKDGKTDRKKEKTGFY